MVRKESNMKLQHHLYCRLPGRTTRQAASRPTRACTLLTGSRRGFGTLEVVIIMAVLLSVALIFRHALLSFATRLIHTVLEQDSIIQEIAIPD
jgi:hypothetical protein